VLPAESSEALGATALQKEPKVETPVKGIKLLRNTSGRNDKKNEQKRTSEAFRK